MKVRTRFREKVLGFIIQRGGPRKARALTILGSMKTGAFKKIQSMSASVVLGRHI